MIGIQKKCDGWRFYLDPFHSQFAIQRHSGFRMDVIHHSKRSPVPIDLLHDHWIWRWFFKRFFTFLLPKWDSTTTKSQSREGFRSVNFSIQKERVTLSLVARSMLRPIRFQDQVSLSSFPFTLQVFNAPSRHLSLKLEATKKAKHPFSQVPSSCLVL